MLTSNIYVSKFFKQTPFEKAAKIQLPHVKTLRPEQDSSHHFADNIFKLLERKLLYFDYNITEACFWMFGCSKSALAQVMAWHWTMTQFTHTYRHHQYLSIKTTSQSGLKGKVVSHENKHDISETEDPTVGSIISAVTVKWGNLWESVGTFLVFKWSQCTKFIHFISPYQAPPRPQWVKG